MAKTARRQAGDGSLYQRADGLWIASVDLGYTAAGKRRRKVVSSKTQAGALAKLREVRRQVGAHGDVPTSSITLGEWMTRWLDDIAAKRVRPRTLDTYRHKRDLIVAAAGGVRLDKLTPAHVRAIHEHAAAGRSSTTALHCHRVLATALKDAEREGVVLRNVALLVDAPRQAVSDRGALTSAQARRLLNAVADEPLASRWAFALLYGARQGEALGLEWDRVDVDRETLDLSWQLQRLTWRHGCADRCGAARGADCPKRHLGIPAGFEVRLLSGAMVLTRPKTRGSARVVPLIPVMRDLLELHRPPDATGLIWRTPADTPIAATIDSRAWHTALASAKLPDVPLHAARHTTATLLLEGGVDPVIIAAILGHSDVVTTRGYQHVDLSLARGALEALGRSLTA